MLLLKLNSLLLVASENVHHLGEVQAVKNFELTRFAFELLKTLLFRLLQTLAFQKPVDQRYLVSQELRLLSFCLLQLLL